MSTTPEPKIRIAYVSGEVIKAFQSAAQTPNETPTPRTDASLWTYKASGAEMVYADFARQLERELNAERDALERERMRLCACGVVAICDTLESAKEARDMHPDYRSASCDDVARRVDECSRLREELSFAKELLREIRDDQVNAQDEADKFLRDHQPSMLSRWKAVAEGLAEIVRYVGTTACGCNHLPEYRKAQKALNNYTGLEAAVCGREQNLQTLQNEAPKERKKPGTIMRAMLWLWRWRWRCTVCRENAADVFGLCDACFSASLSATARQSSNLNPITPMTANNNATDVQGLRDSLMQYKREMTEALDAIEPLRGDHTVSLPLGKSIITHGIKELLRQRDELRAKVEELEGQSFVRVMEEAIAVEGRIVATRLDAPVVGTRPEGPNGPTVEVYADQLIRSMAVRVLDRPHHNEIEHLPGSEAFRHGDYVQVIIRKTPK